MRVLGNIMRVVLMAGAIVCGVDLRGDSLAGGCQCAHGETANVFRADALLGLWRMDGRQSSIGRSAWSDPTNAIGSGSGGFTISTWVAGRNFRVGKRIARWEDPSSNSWELDLEPEGGARLTFSSAFGPVLSLETEGPLFRGDEEWRHVAGVHDAAMNAAFLYVDGALRASSDGLAAWHPMALGHLELGHGVAADDPVVLDDMRLYGVPLGSEEIALLSSSNIEPLGGNLDGESLEDGAGSYAEASNGPVTGGDMTLFEFSVCPGCEPYACGCSGCSSGCCGCTSCSSPPQGCPGCEANYCACFGCSGGCCSCASCSPPPICSGCQFFGCGCPGCAGECGCGCTYCDPPQGCADCAVYGCSCNGCGGGCCPCMTCTPPPPPTCPGCQANGCGCPGCSSGCCPCAECQPTPSVCPGCKPNSCLCGGCSGACGCGCTQCQPPVCPGCEASGWCTCPGCQAGCCSCPYCEIVAPMICSGCALNDCDCEGCSGECDCGCPMCFEWLQMDHVL